MMLSTEIICYKAFDADLKCRGFQYAIGETYKLDGEPVICEHGFHACENPFDVFDYYPIGSRLAQVTISGAVDRKRDGNSKVCGASITIGAEIHLPEIIAIAVKWIIKAAKGNTATGDYGHAAATGHRGHAAATGDWGHAAATGHRGHAAATGDYGHAAATGHRGHAAATGDWGHAAATGVRGHAAATGVGSIAASLGIDGTALAEKGGAISLACYRWNRDTSRYDIVAVKSSLVGKNGVMAGKVYKLSEAGKFVEVAS